MAPTTTIKNANANTTVHRPVIEAGADLLPHAVEVGDAAAAAPGVTRDPGPRHHEAAADTLRRGDEVLGGDPGAFRVLEADRLLTTHA